jgi:hypothetical protein
MSVHKTDAPNRLSGLCLPSTSLSLSHFNENEIVIIGRRFIHEAVSKFTDSSNFSRSVSDIDPVLSRFRFSERISVRLHKDKPVPAFSSAPRHQDI